MKKFSRAITLITLSLSLILIKQTCQAMADKEQIKTTLTPQLSLSSKQASQGSFISAIISDVKEKPTLWFNTKAYHPFEIAENTYRALIPVENLTPPGQYAIQARAKDWEEKIPVQVLDNKKGVQHITLTPGRNSIEPTASELNQIATAFQAKSAKQFWEGKFIYPSPASKSSPFGVKRSYNNGPIDSYHKGLDFAAALGSAVIAPADGEVILTGYVEKDFHLHGNTIILDHGHGVTSIYMHLSKIEVKPGQKVKQGQKIAEVGHTGISTGPHLHWGVYLYGTSTDPELFIANPIR